MAKTAKELVAETMAGRFDPNTEQCLFVSLAKNYCVWKDGIPDIAEVAGALYQIPVETEEEKLAVMDYLNQSMDQYLLEPIPSYDAKEYSKCCRDYGKSWKSCGISIHAYDQACAAFLGRCALYREYSSAAKQDSVLPVHGLDHAYAAAVDHDRKYCSSRNLDARSKAMADARESVMRRHNREHARDRSWRTRRRADIEDPSLSMTRLAVVGEMPMDNGEYLLKIQVAQDVPNSGISRPGFTTGNPDCFLSMPQANGFKLYTICLKNLRQGRHRMGRSFLRFLTAIKKSRRFFRLFFGYSIAFCVTDGHWTVCLFGMLKFQSVVPVPFFREQIVPVMVSA